MAWQNPKTNWQAGDIPGAEDFNRSEGNAEYLKGQTDGLKNGSITAGKATNATNATKAGDAAKFDGKLPLYYLHAYPIMLFAGSPPFSTPSGDWSPVDGRFQWIDRYTLGGRAVRLKANLWQSGQGIARLRLRDYTQGTVITLINTRDHANADEIATSSNLTIPHNSVIGIELSSSGGTARLARAWLEVYV